MRYPSTSGMLAINQILVNRYHASMQIPSHFSLTTDEQVLNICALQDVQKTAEAVSVAACEQAAFPGEYLEPAFPTFDLVDMVGHH
jgi:hypothetical protein